MGKGEGEAREWKKNFKYWMNTEQVIRSSCIRIDYQFMFSDSNVSSEDSREQVLVLKLKLFNTR